MLVSALVFIALVETACDARGSHFLPGGTPSIETIPASLSFASPSSPGQSVEVQYSSFPSGDVAPHVSSTPPCAYMTSVTTTYGSGVGFLEAPATVTPSAPGICVVELVADAEEDSEEGWNPDYVTSLYVGVGMQLDSLAPAEIPFNMQVPGPLHGSDTFVLTSSNPTVATVPASVAFGSDPGEIPITPHAAGETNIGVSVDGRSLVVAVSIVPITTPITIQGSAR